jgi:membrane protein
VTSDTKAATGIPALIQRIMKLKPVRVFQHFSQLGGPLLAAGMSYQALFAIFAGLWVGFSIAGFVLKSNVELQQAVITFVGDAIPGLFGDNGAVDPQVLLNASVLGWTGAIALVGLLLTALGWLASTRDAIRRLFGLPGDKTFFLLLKLKDLGLAVGFGIAVIVSAALSVGSTSLLATVFSLVGIDHESVGATIVARIVGLLIAFALDTAVLVAFYRVLSGIRIPFRRVISGALLGAAALGVLKALGSALLGGASNNPLLASFAVIIGLLIWFNLICQVILIAATWIAVGTSDVGLDLRGLSTTELAEEARTQEEEARFVLAKAARERLESELRDAHGWKRRGLARRLKRAARQEAELRR